MIFFKYRYQFSGSYRTGRTSLGGLLRGQPLDNRLLRVDASEVIHLYLCDRRGQSRGVPWFHTALVRLHNLGGYEESEIVAARAQASVMGFIQSPKGDLYGQLNNYTGQKTTNLAPGAIEVLSPGETFAGFAPTRPNSGFDPFVRCMLRAIAAGLGMSYESLSRDYSNTSYSSARTALIDERDCYRVLQGWLIRKFHRRVFKTWLEMAVLSNAIALPGYETNPTYYRQDKWVARGWQWVDPESEVNAYKEAIKAGFTTISEVIAQTGLDVEDVFKERRRELDLATELELEFDTEVKSQESKVKSEEGATNGNDTEGLSPESNSGVYKPRTETSPEEEKVTLEELFRSISFTGIRAKKRTAHAEVSSACGRSKNCKKGKACGKACISQSKQCNKGLSPAATKAVLELIRKQKIKKLIVESLHELKSHKS